MHAEFTPTWTPGRGHRWAGMTPLERLLARVVCDVRSRCWISAHKRDGKGYTQISISGRRWLSHRLAYDLLVGPVPAGLELDHLCRNRLCCNPAHLEPVSHRTNSLRGGSFSAINATKTHCRNGHPFTPENTKPRRRGGRDCRICHRANGKRRYHAAKRTDEHP